MLLIMLVVQNSFRHCTSLNIIKILPRPTRHLLRVSPFSLSPLRSIQTVFGSFSSTTGFRSITVTCTSSPLRPLYIFCSSTVLNDYLTSVFPPQKESCSYSITRVSTFVRGGTLHFVSLR